MNEIEWIIKTTTKRNPGIRSHLTPAAIAILERQYYKSKKAAGDISSINSIYHDQITRALIAYFEGGGIAASRNDFKQSTITAFSDAFDAGWVDGGAELPVDENALAWIEDRINEEFGYIDALFETAKELRKDKSFDFFAWTSARADAYTNTLRSIYNYARLNVTDNIMVTFGGDSGKESCPDCKRLYGKRHRLSWFIQNDVVPPTGGGLECSKGGHCEHHLIDDHGEVITI